MVPVNKYKGHQVERKENIHESLNPPQCFLSFCATVCSNTGFTHS